MIIKFLQSNKGTDSTEFYDSAKDLNRKFGIHFTQKPAGRWCGKAAIVCVFMFKWS